MLIPAYSLGIQKKMYQCGEGSKVPSSQVHEDAGEQEHRDGLEHPGMKMMAYSAGAERNQSRAERSDFWYAYASDENCAQELGPVGSRYECQHR